VLGQVGEKSMLWSAAAGRLIDPAESGVKTSKWKVVVDCGKRVVTCECAYELEIRDARTGGVLGPPIPRERVPSFYELWQSWSADGKRIVLPAADKRPQVWDVTAGKPLTPPLGSADQGHNGWAVFSPDGRVVVTRGVENDDGKGGWTCQCRLWETATGKPLSPELTGDPQVSAFSPDNNTLVLRTKRTDKESEFVLWDVAARKARGEPLRGAGSINRVAFGPDGRTVYAASDPAKPLSVWDAATGRLLGESTA
jgi:dipeptidyl aminopeptidase/acylaminoacyl peptidase